jgi:hypothetical protein
VNPPAKALFTSSATKNRALPPPLTHSAADRFRPARESSRAHTAFAPLFTAQDPLLRPLAWISPQLNIGEHCPSCTSPSLVFSNDGLMSLRTSCSCRTHSRGFPLPSHHLRPRMLQELCAPSASLVRNPFLAIPCRPWCSRAMVLALSWFITQTRLCLSTDEPPAGAPHRAPVITLRSLSTCTLVAWVVARPLPWAG